MQTPLEINARHIRLTDKLEALIRERSEHLERYYPRLIRCHVSLDGPSGHRRSGGPFDVRIDLRVPGKEIVVTHQQSDDLPAAVRDAFDAARRQLQDYASRQRGETKNHEEAPEGTVSKVFANRGYGFIQTSDGREIYFHQNSVLGEGFANLTEGIQVRFSEEMGDDGPQASTVSVLAD